MTAGAQIVQICTITSSPVMHQADMQIGGYAYGRSHKGNNAQ